MRLPKLEVPTYEETMPISGKKVKYRPFLSKEEKLLLMAKESNNVSSALSTVNDLVRACTFEKVDPTTMAATDLEWFFLKLRQVSIGEVVELARRCAVKDAEGKVCGGLVNFSIDLKEIEAPKFDKSTARVSLDNKISVVMKLPSIMLLEKIDTGATDDDLIADLIEFIIDGETIYDPKDVTKEEMMEFIGSLSLKQKNMIREFIYSMPRISIKKPFCCPKCGNSGEYNFSGIKSFFG